MNGIWIGLSAVIDDKNIVECLSRAFPKAQSMLQAEAVRPGITPRPPIVLSVEHKPIRDFPTIISFDCFPGPNEDAINVGIALAKRLASIYRCRTICDGSGFGDDASPYWSIICDGEKWFLADDLNTALADGEGGEVRTVRELALHVAELDEHGLLKQQDQRTEKR